jgi:ketosteroid isomerase-like protein
MRSLLIVVLLAACTASSGDTPGADTVSAGELRESVMRADRAFNADFAKRRIEGWVEWFDTAGMQVEPGGTTPKGHDQIRAHMTKTFGDSARILDWRPVMAEVSDDGTLGYTIGTYNFHVRGRDSAASASTGHYLTVWRRQADGSWKVLADIGTQHPKKR